MSVVLVIVGLVVGLAVGWLYATSRSAAEIARLDATLRAARDGEERLGQSLRALSADAARDQQIALGHLIAPLADSLARYERRVLEMEHDRVDAYAELRTEVRSVAGASADLRTETSHLVAALRAPQVRGRWGEHQLRRIVEAAGMLEHCDFEEQVTVQIDGGGVRPDLVVRLSGGRHVVVDAKAPFDAYLAAMEARDDRTRDSQLKSHAGALRAHVDTLSAKSYWTGFPTTPEFVVLFVPADPFLDAALQHDPTLLEHAFGRDVVLATPATLIALLRTVAYAWRQEALASNAFTVHTLARDLYARLSTMGDHLTKLGASLGGAVTAYNRAVGSLESRVLVSARKLADLGVSGEALPEVAPLEVAPRRPQAPEFDDDARNDSGPSADGAPNVGATWKTVT
ncbi:MAG TPA: DNA recombination protein RmuC [Micromonosporaceae bacterium]|nr:DNA recombination protein RmuC [Micromonosporaceae bacterium]